MFSLRWAAAGNKMQKSLAMSGDYENELEAAVWPLSAPQLLLAAVHSDYIN